MEPVEKNRVTMKDLKIASVGGGAGIIMHISQVERYQRKVASIDVSDKSRQSVWCRWLLGKIKGDSNFLKRFLWTDHEVFSVAEAHQFLSKQNGQSDQETNETLENSKGSVSVWAGILDDIIIGPHIFLSPINASSYLNFLQETLPDLLDDVPLDVRGSMYFQHDGKPGHCSSDVESYLQEAFPKRWIGSKGPIYWPARSRILNLCHFFLWKYCKRNVYAQPIRNQRELIQQIRKVFTDLKSNRKKLINVQTKIIKKYRSNLQKWNE